MLYILFVLALFLSLILLISIFLNNINKSHLFRAKLYFVILTVLFIVIGLKLALDQQLFKKLADKIPYGQIVQSFYNQTKDKIDYEFAYSQSPVVRLLTPDLANLKESVLLDIPVISQLPELPRGCEVTSLAMLINNAGIKVDKLTLASEIKQEKIGVITENGKKIYGNPHYGFVGDMYSLANFGLGVYHEPIRELAEQYLPGQIKDFSNGEFNEILYHLGKNRPVWVIINTQYRQLPSTYFQTWHTKAGVINVTFKEHSVLVTGYDQNYIYFNDPLTNTKNKKAPIADFKNAWVQMGKQAITVIQ